MKLKLSFQVLSIAIAATFLLSCGTSSNGIFEKRKHLKGWHFKKNKTFSFGQSSNGKSNEIKLQESLINTPSNSVSSLKNDKKIRNRELKQLRNISISTIQRANLEGNSMVENRVLRFQKEGKDELNLVFNVTNSAGRVDQKNINRTVEKVSNNKNRQVKKDKILTSNQILFRTFLIVFFFGILFLGFFILAYAMAYNDEILGLAVLAFGVVLCFTFVDFLVQMLHSKPEERGKWTFWRSLKRVLFILSITVLTIYTVNFLMNINT